MKKRVVATILWFYAGWYAGAMLAELFGLSPALGPILGTAVAAIVGGDPRGIIWTKREVETPAEGQDVRPPTEVQAAPDRVRIPA